MAFNDIERQRCERDIAKFMERHRPPPHIRPELDFGYRINGHSIEIFEIRPDWQNPKQKMEHPVAKATNPTRKFAVCKAFLEVVGRDEYCCFFG